MQARGEHNPRDFDKYICRLPIPLYEPDIGVHRQLVILAERAETVAATTEAPAGHVSRDQLSDHTLLPTAWLRLMCDTVASFDVWLPLMRVS